MTGLDSRYGKDGSGQLRRMNVKEARVEVREEAGGGTEHFGGQTSAGLLLTRMTGDADETLRRGAGESEGSRP